jgi:uncharacterized membrane protein
MIVLTFYFSPGQRESEEIRTALLDLEKKYPIQIVFVDVLQDEQLAKAYRDLVPIIKIGPYRLQYPFTAQDMQVTISAAVSRHEHLEKVGDNAHSRKVERGHTLTSADRISLWLSKLYMALINVMLAIYIGLPFLAPVLANNGVQAPARVIYAIYSPLCHQLPYRSFFLFGAQPYYPRALADINGVGTYEDFFGENSTQVTTVRKFTGMEEIGAGVGRLGYKVALCERDVAIYLALLAFGILFSVTGRKIRPLSWYLWIAIGIVPIGLDGVSQLPSLISMFPDWIIMRESTPVLRVVTGALFGLATAWFLYPMIEESMNETRNLLAGKRIIIPQLQKSE